MIAFLGTGLLGSGLAEAAAKRGEQITVWNRTLEKARALEAFGIKVAQTPADAVRGASRVHLVLKDDAAVDAVIAALRPGLDASATIVDHTTNHPASTAERARRLASEGVRYLHCPVFIGPAAARRGQGTIMAAGPRALFDDVHAALAPMAERVEYLGERPDLAAVFKLCGNTFIIGTSALIADMLTIARASGVAPNDLLKVFDYFSAAAGIAGRGRNMAAGNYAPSFELAMARKDVRLMTETVDGRPLAALPAIAARMDQLIAKGHAEDDLAVLGVDE